MRTLLVSVLALALLPASGALAGEPANLVSNHSFEAGRTGPEGWTVFALGAGGWEYGGPDGERCVTVTGLGDDASWWTPEQRIEFKPGHLYHMSYWVRKTPQTEDGVAIAGLDWVNHDTRPHTEWDRRTFCFRTPDAALSNALFRVGQWHVKGTLLFDNIVVTPAIAVHQRSADLGFALGAGEKIVDGKYVAAHPMRGPGSTDFRCLESFTSHFNTNRWMFDGAGQVVYRHGVGRLRQAEPEVEVRVNRLVEGSLLIDGSKDGKQWFNLGEIEETERVAFPLPADLLPARELWVRLRSTDDADLQVNSYEYRCRLPEAAPVKGVMGATQYFAILRDTGDLDVRVEEVGSLRPGAEGSIEVSLTNRGPRRALVMQLEIEHPGGDSAGSEDRYSLSPGGSRRFVLPYELTACGDYSIRLRGVEATSDEVLWEAESEFSVPSLYDARGGKLIHRDANLAVWSCDPERKVSRGRPAPTSGQASVRMSAAANEYEAVQLVLTPSVPLSACRLRAGPLTAASGAVIPASEVEVRKVEYVFVSEPTDQVGAVGYWPDPLPLHKEPGDLVGGENQPFWITVHVPPGTPPGDYGGAVEIEANDLSREIPLVVHVWDFELPAETHVRSGFGLWPWWIRRYHNLDSDEELFEVYRLYLRNFAEHRIAPFSFGQSIEVEWKEDRWGDAMPALNVVGFERDARFALDELAFNSFRLDLAGLGGGTYHSRRPGKIAGSEQGTPKYETAFRRYARAVQTYLQERGWLDEAYIYWFDEPEEKDYDFVRETMERIGGVAPELTRMLTEHPTNELYGAVDLWCLPTFTLDPETARIRQRVGEEIWWYLCTAPKAPHFTLFLDHYGTEMRLWLWETWKYGIDGILVWQSNYWTSGSAYPEPLLQNPWQDPMSWMSGYGLEKGGRRPWGNGDGRFLYPPNRDPEHDDTKYIQGPIPSIRWELLRDGIEDYEYFWLLRREIERLREAGVAPSVYEAEEKLLEVPQEICRSLTEFTITPEPIYEHREKLADAIERLGGY
jgi:hypothetical protein